MRDFMRPIRVLLADDHTLLVEGMRKLIESDFELVGTAADGQELLAEAERLRPDVILIDITMPLLSGTDAARQLRQRGVHAKLLFVTMHSSTDYVMEAFRAGAAGYVLKHAAGVELVQAIHEVMKGNIYLSPLVRRDRRTELTEQVWAKHPVSARASGQLTRRQREVLQLVAGGMSAKAAAEVLNISRKTVEFHKAGMMRQLGLQTTAELVRYALSHELNDVYGADS